MKSAFSNWQASRQEAREAVLASFLAALKKGKAQFRCVSHLAVLAAEHIAEKEGRRCDRATLLRNPRYKKQLLAFLAARTPHGTDAIRRSAIRDPSAIALLNTAELSNQNLRLENARLKRHLSEIATKTEAARAEGSTPPDAAIARDAGLCTGDDGDRQKFDSTCRVLETVLRSLEGILIVDMPNERIVDMSQIPPRALVSGEVVKPYLLWCRRTGRLDAVVG